MRGWRIWAAALLVLAGIGALAPWLSDARAKARATAAFEAAWAQVSDGCGFNCKGCGALATSPVPFGRRVRIEYACGLLPADSPQYHRQQEVFVSAIGTVHGLPHP